MRAGRWIAIVPALVAGLAAAPASAQTRTYTRLETTEVRVEEPDADFARFRFGVSGVGGAMLNGPDLAMGGLEVRVGMQIGDYLGIYYMPIGTIGSFYSQPGGETAVGGTLFNNAMIDLTLGDVFTIGGGASVDFVFGCNQAIQEEVQCADEGDPMFGAHGRIAANVLPMGGPGHRHALTLSFDVHPTFFDFEDWDDIGWTLLGGIGFEMM